MQLAIEGLLDAMTDLSIIEGEVQQWYIPIKAVVNQTQAEGTDLDLKTKSTKDSTNYNIDSPTQRCHYKHEHHTCIESIVNFFSSSFLMLARTLCALLSGS